MESKGHYYKGKYQSSESRYNELDWRKLTVCRVDTLIIILIVFNTFTLLITYQIQRGRYLARKQNQTNAVSIHMPSFLTDISDLVGVSFHTQVWKEISHSPKSFLDNNDPDLSDQA